AGRADVFLALAARGVAVLAYDYRGYGRSEGRPSEPGVYLDVEAAYDSLRARGGPARQIVAFGEALGGAVAVRAATVRPCAGPARRDRRLRARGGGVSGRVCVVTGASSGIGRATAQALARLGATLALVCRDRGRGEETLAALRAESSAAAVALFLADLSSRAEIRRLAAELGERYPAIHVLVNNAGVINLRRSTTVDGIETVFAVNHLAYFLLPHPLVARLRASAPARIVNVASDAHRFGRIDLGDLGHARRYRAMRVYG